MFVEKSERGGKKVVLYLWKEKVKEMLTLLTENFVDRLRQGLSICKFLFPHNPLNSFWHCCLSTFFMLLWIWFDSAPKSFVLQIACWISNAKGWRINKKNVHIQIYKHNWVFTVYTHTHSLYLFSPCNLFYSKDILSRTSKIRKTDIYV